MKQILLSTKPNISLITFSTCVMTLMKLLLNLLRDPDNQVKGFQGASKHNLMGYKDTSQMSGGKVPPLCSLEEEVHVV